MLGAGLALVTGAWAYAESASAKEQRLTTGKAVGFAAVSAAVFVATAASACIVAV